MSIDGEGDLIALRGVGEVVALTLRAMAAAVRPGVTTAELDAVGAAVFRQHGARSAPQLIYNFPGVTCISVNDEAVHGIPGPRRLLPGDLVKLDVTAERDGYFADAAVTVGVPPITHQVARLIAVAEAALRRGIEVTRAGRPVNEIGRAVERAVRRGGFGVLPELTGHGVGRHIHEPPPVPNFFDRRQTDRLRDGLVITIEPIVTTGGEETLDSGDGWTVKTADGGLSAHAEHTIVVTRGTPIIITQMREA